ncbi:ribonuclease H [Staphylococcus phage vB_StaM_PB50]|nr:ribonuclease H [Staphylococcus phage vB_StaM_PB50]
MNLIDFKKYLNENSNKVTIYCDGAIKGVKSKGTKYGGLGIYLPEENRPFESMGIPVMDEKLTNNNLEILSFIFSALFAIETYKGDRKLNINIKTDSRYVVDGFNKYLLKWSENGWLTNTGTPIKNKELWLLVDDIKHNLGMKFNINLSWTKGHNKSIDQDSKYNEIADEYANKGKLLAYENNDEAYSYDYIIEKITEFVNNLK